MKTKIKWDIVFLYFAIIPITGFMFWYGVINLLQWLF